MLLGLIAPSAGQVYLLGRRLPDPRVVAQAGSMIEEPAFYPWMTGRVNLEVLGATGGGCGPGEAARVLRLAGLADVAARKVKTYSQGMRQRLGIAAAMLGRPAAGPVAGQARGRAVAGRARQRPGRERRPGSRRGGRRVGDRRAARAGGQVPRDHREGGRTCCGCWQLSSAS